MDFQIKKCSSSGKDGMKNISEQIHPSLHSLLCMYGKTACLCPPGKLPADPATLPVGLPSHVPTSSSPRASTESAQLWWRQAQFPIPPVFSRDQGQRPSRASWRSLSCCLSSCSDTEPCSCKAQDTSSHMAQHGATSSCAPLGLTRQPNSAELLCTHCGPWPHFLFDIP